ncbi:MAG: hypothetical protein K9M10_00330 [Candidatus Pacebacteria bacterium]|nr:hypothetical protein [Candidatus Paceibacterota bacterium]MCF7856909.1 hypothetical protein [Candidatus Paceibacterota bacterium]
MEKTTAGALRRISPTEARKFKITMERLKRLSIGKYILHGSRKRSRLLLPKRSKPARIRTPFQNQKAVYATGNPIIAIVYATLDNLPWQNVREKGVVVFIKEGEQLCPHGGYIHVLPNKGFVGSLRMSYSRQPIRPVAVIKAYPITPYILTMFGKLIVARTQTRTT